MKALSAASLVGLLLVSWIGVTSGAVITVTSGTDPIDIDWQTATIADLPGPDGKVSFSEAMIAADNTPGHDTIEFAVPQSEWQLQFLFPNCATIYSSYTYFWRASESVTIDGTTQTAFTGDTNPDGAELVLYGSQVALGGNSTYQGVHAGAVAVSGSNSLVTGNTGGINITVGGGGGNEIRGNDAGTIKVDRSSNNIVAGNTCNRVRVWGAASSGLPADGNTIGGPDLADRNYITGYGYVNSEGLPSGTAIQLASVAGTMIENNWIGLALDGVSQGNMIGTHGIWFEGENYDTTVRNNRIAGILGHGQGPHHAGQLFGWAIMISGSGSGIAITGNTFGLDANDQPLLGSVTGIDIGTWAYSNAADITITDNVVAGSVLNGIVVGANVPQVRLMRNAVYENGTLGIDLIPSSYGYGVTPNDPLDADTGGNGLQNFPVVASATSNGTSVAVTGSLNSYPNSDFTLEFFISPACDASGFGEGEQFLGATTVSTNASGDATFDVVLPGSAVGGSVLSATATLEPLGATSEFSACVDVQDGVIVGIDDAVTPHRARLLGAHPNPFRTQASLSFEMALPGPARIEIYDVAGRRVRTLVNEYRDAGRYDVTWDGRNDAGRAVSSGVYFYRLSVDGFAEARKLALVD